mmetsp:Transcript_157470/g.277800  ORF Transcript_157470/g.277800 Transcript_157470/m.277800 type:complete len:224 (-) Transcript_157470:16-687(-)
MFAELDGHQHAGEEFSAFPEPHGCHPLVLEQWPLFRATHLHLSSGRPTAFHPFLFKCPPVATGEVGAVLAAKVRVREAMELLKNTRTDEAWHLCNRAMKRLKWFKGTITYMLIRLFKNWPEELFKTRMDLEQAAENAREYAHGSKSGDLLACAVSDLWPYDPHPNIHPMDRRISANPWPLALLGAPWGSGRPAPKEANQPLQRGSGQTVVPRRRGPAAVADFL